MGYFVKNRYIQSGSTGAVIPGGTSSERIQNPVDGYIRFNTSYQQLEDWNGLSWSPIGANAITTITNQALPTDGTNASFTLNQSSTANAAYVTLNGLAQTPNVDYTITGSILTFTSVPPADNLGQIRFLDGNQSGISIIANQTITPDGFSSSYTMIQPSPTNALLVTINGVLQRPGTYLTNGTTITFTTRPLVSDIIQIRYIGSANPNELNIITQSLVANGVDSTYYLNSVTNATAILVTQNGILQSPNIDYTVDGISITFTSAPPMGQEIDIRVIGSTDTYGLIYNTNGSGFVEVTTTPSVILNAGGVNSVVATDSMVYINTDMTLNSNIVSNSDLTVFADNSIALSVNGFTVLTSDQTNILDISGSQSLQLPTYTTAVAQSLANLTPGQVIYVSDGDTGSPCLAVYDGTDWRTVSLGAPIGP
jgi:hypothetical protein